MSEETENEGRFSPGDQSLEESAARFDQFVEETPAGLVEETVSTEYVPASTEPFDPSQSAAQSSTASFSADAQGSPAPGQNGYPSYPTPQPGYTPPVPQGGFQQFPGGPQAGSSAYGAEQAGAPAYGQASGQPWAGSQNAYASGAYPNNGYANNQYPNNAYPGTDYTQFSVQEVPWSDKSKLAAGLFGILLGAFGVHNFYLGFTGKAVAQLLITILSFGLLSFVSAIWGLVEGILSAAVGTQWDLDAAGRPMRPIGQSQA